MKGYFVLILCALVLNVESYKTENELDYDCPEICPKIIEPLCAFDGNNKFKYFHNECLMRFNKCRNGSSWTPTHMTLCLHQIDPLVLQDCLRPCPFIYDPICASNGEYTEVFGNNCIYDMENCFTNNKWKQIKTNDCGLEED
ncbi:U-Kazal-Dg21.2-like [Episyrphus balteatus]|uniref:U-Kazal-Dg21.2-like n=1 Tax=Episyrphus balteatus TaxID=286459 RepID=UPI0024864CDE|nr:U-Kazal-Dg21.2-like [Episyrphus balteatus]